MNCRAPPSAWPPPYLAIDAAQLPPLPVAANPTLEFRWARHKTYYMDRDGQNDLDAAHRSNLRLEWRGDAMLRWAISDAISELLPYTPLADLSHIRQYLDSNRTLAHLAYLYELDQQLVTGPPPPQHDSWTHVLKTMADTFEARLGATVDASADASTQAAQMAAVLSFVRRLVSPDVFPELRDIIDYYARVKIPRRFGNQRVELRKIETFLKSLRDVVEADQHADQCLMSDPRHKWVDERVPGPDRREWRTTLYLDGQAVASGDSHKLVRARQQALERYFWMTVPA
ncbi:hypothetical protein JCM3766R1_005298 [Sporobolomyces carnicolor]